MTGPASHLVKLMTQSAKTNTLFSLTIILKKVSPLDRIPGIGLHIQAAASLSSSSATLLVTGENE